MLVRSGMEIWEWKYYGNGNIMGMEIWEWKYRNGNKGMEIYMYYDIGTIHIYMNE